MRRCAAVAGAIKAELRDRLTTGCGDGAIQGRAGGAPGTRDAAIAPARAAHSSRRRALPTAARAGRPLRFVLRARARGVRTAPERRRTARGTPLRLASPRRDRLHWPRGPAAAGSEQAQRLAIVSAAEPRPGHPAHEGSAKPQRRGPALRFSRRPHGVRRTTRTPVAGDHASTQPPRVHRPPSGSRRAGGRVRILHRMSAAAGQLRLRSRIEFGDYPVDAAWSPDGKAVVVACGAGAISLAQIEADASARPIGAHAGGALAVAWQKAGNLFASSGQDGAVRLWDARTLESRAIHEGAEWSEHLAFADNGRLLAVATGRTLRLFDASGALRT